MQLLYHNTLIFFIKFERKVPKHLFTYKIFTWSYLERLLTYIFKNIIIRPSIFGTKQSSERQPFKLLCFLWIKTIRRSILRPWVRWWQGGAKRHHPTPRNGINTKAALPKGYDIGRYDACCSEGRPPASPTWSCNYCGPWPHCIR